MTLLVTGGGGFVLAHLARAWAALPGARVVVLDVAFDDPVRAFLAHPAIELVTGSVTERAALAALPRDISHVVHGAAITSIRARVASGGIAAALEPLAVNMMGVAEMLAFAERLPGLTRLVNVSSGAVYARAAANPGGGALPETGALAPEGFYALSKHAGEGLVEEARRLGLPALSVRLSSVFGPLDRALPSRSVAGLVKQLALAAREGQEVSLQGLQGGGDFLGAGEVARGLIALLWAPAIDQGTCNLAAGHFTTLADLAAMVPGLRWHKGPGGITCEEADRGGRNGAYDIARIRAATGWTPAPLASQIADYAAWLRTHPD